MRSNSILPIGTVNCKTGANAMFGSMWDCWEEDATSHNMLVQFSDGKFKLVHTCGEGEVVGYEADYHHDQTRRTYGRGVVIACEPHTKEGLMNLGARAGKTSINMATYK